MLCYGSRNPHLFLKKKTWSFSIIIGTTSRKATFIYHNPLWGNQKWAHIAQYEPYETILCNMNHILTNETLLRTVNSYVNIWIYNAQCIFTCRHVIMSAFFNMPTCYLIMRNMVWYTEMVLYVNMWVCNAHYQSIWWHMGQIEQYSFICRHINHMHSMSLYGDIWESASRLKAQYGLICPHVVIIFQNSFICRDMAHFAQHDVSLMWLHISTYGFIMRNIVSCVDLLI